MQRAATGAGSACSSKSLPFNPPHRIPPARRRGGEDIPMSAVTQPKARPRRAAVAPRFLRATHEAPAYLGMSRDEFNKTVRPYVREFPIGEQGIGFDREELDAWADAYAEKQAIAKGAAQVNNPSRSERHGGNTAWREKPSRAS